MTAKIFVDVTDGPEPVVKVRLVDTDHPMLLTLEEAREICSALHRFDATKAHEEEDEEFMDDDVLVGMFGNIKNQLDRLSVMGGGH